MSFIFKSTLADAGSALVGAAKSNKVFQGVALTAILGGGLYKLRKTSNDAAAKAKFMDMVKNQKKGEVFIYCPPRILDGAAHLSGNIIKIEAFCRVNKVPYHMVMGFANSGFSPTETSPFISLDGELTGDSQFCVDAIAKRFNLPEANLSAKDASGSVLVRKTMDLSLNQHMGRTTMVDNGPVMLDFFKTKFAPLMGVPAFLVPFGFSSYRKSYINKLNTSGLGWLDTERYQLEFTRDVEAIAYLVEASQSNGNKYLFGNVPSSADCGLYGLITTVKPHVEKMTVNTGAAKAFVTNPALVKFCQDFEAEVYPDLKDISPCGATTQSFVQ